MNNDREIFERLCNIPAGIYYCSEENKYKTHYESQNAPKVADDYDKMWEVWQAAKEGMIPSINFEVLNQQKQLVEIDLNWHKDEIEHLKADKEKLRGHLQNCANSLEGVIRRHPGESRRLAGARDSANKILTETLK